jgi:hypothetical protein
LHAKLRTDVVEGGPPFDHNGQFLGQAEFWNLICPYGEFDISFRPSGFENGYADLVVRSHTVLVDGIEVPIADLSDVIRSKEADGRPKDLRVLPILYRHRADLDSRRE